MQAGSFFRAGMRQGFSEQTPRCLWRRQRGAAPLQLPGPSLPPRAPAPGRPDPAVGCCSPPAKCSPFAAVLLSPPWERTPAPACRSSILRGLRSSGLSGVFVVPRSPLQGQAPDWTEEGPQGGAGPHARRWRPGSGRGAGLSPSLLAGRLRALATTCVSAWGGGLRA